MVAEHHNPNPSCRTTLRKEFIHLGSRLLAAETNTPSAGGCLAETKYITPDHLGSTRAVTDASATVDSRHDYLPFGKEIPTDFGGRASVAGYGAEERILQRFTGKEVDPETGLQYFLARYYSGRQGRFSSPDPENAGAYEDDPQTWNGYAYVRNNPLAFTDPTGEDMRVCDINGKNCADLTDDEFAEFQKRSRNTLVFRGNKIFVNNPAGGQTLIGTLTEIPTLKRETALALRSVALSAGPVVEFLSDATMGFLTTAGPGILSAARALPAVEASLGRALLSAGTKAAAREALETIPMTSVQKEAVKRAIRRATTTERVSIERLADGSIRVLKTRPGVEGFQVISTIVDTAGASRTVQVGVSSVGQVTHYDVK